MYPWRVSVLRQRSNDDTHLASVGPIARKYLAYCGIPPTRLNGAVLDEDSAPPLFPLEFIDHEARIVALEP